MWKFISIQSNYPQKIQLSESIFKIYKNVSIKFDTLIMQYDASKEKRIKKLMNIIYLFKHYNPHIFM